VPLCFLGLQASRPGPTSILRRFLLYQYVLNNNWYLTKELHNLRIQQPEYNNPASPSSWVPDCASCPSGRDISALVIIHNHFAGIRK
jgi:hypothetical protein